MTNPLDDSNLSDGLLSMDVGVKLSEIAAEEAVSNLCDKHNAYVKLESGFAKEGFPSIDPLSDKSIEVRGELFKLFLTMLSSRGLVVITE